MHATVRTMIRPDWAIFEVDERQEFGARGWGLAEFRRVFSRPRVNGYVIADGYGIPLGYCIYRATAEKLQIVRLLISHEHRRQGLGTLLVDRLARKLGHDRQTELQAITADKNTAGQMFLRSLGFWGELRDRGILFRLQLCPPEVNNRLTQCT